MDDLAAHEDQLQRAAAAVREAEALVFCAGAGMGVDSGLPDFRGDEGFWNAYPPYRHLNVGFVDMANPRWFRDDPAFAWGFYGHRRNLYRATTPHRGFALLRDWADAKPLGAFVFTSNVDGHFQKAGFDPQRVLECHGSILQDQCLGDCGADIWPSADDEIPIDESTMRAADPLPSCPTCGGLARPNILMFYDSGWDETRTSAQERRLNDWLGRVGSRPTAIIECGAGTAVPSVRFFAERLADRLSGATLIRINPREPQAPRHAIGLPFGALAALEAIADRL